jgi:hypothetical protein
MSGATGGSCNGRYTGRPSGRGTGLTLDARPRGVGGSIKNSMIWGPANPDDQMSAASGAQLNHPRFQDDQKSSGQSWLRPLLSK